MNTIKLIIVVSMVLLVTDLIYHQVVNAQSESEFKTYTNNENDLNFTIQYPSDWKVKNYSGIY